MALHIDAHTTRISVGLAHGGWTGSKSAWYEGEVEPFSYRSLWCMIQGKSSSSERTVDRTGRTIGSLR